MGPATTFHMLLGAILGWAILSPLAKHKGWAPGPVENFEDGSRGWIVWISLAIMLADSLVSLGWLILRPIILHGPHYFSLLRHHAKENKFTSLFRVPGPSRGAYTVLSPSSPPSKPSKRPEQIEEPDAPPEHLVSNRTILILFILSVLFCIIAVHSVFGSLIPLSSTLLAILLALILSLLGVRALGETDLNPVSGISKITVSHLLRIQFPIATL